MDGNADSKEAASRVAGMHSAQAKSRGGGEENGNAAVRAEGLVRSAVSRGPEGLTGPISSPLTFLGGGGAVGLEEGKNIRGGTA